MKSIRRPIEYTHFILGTGWLLGLYITDLSLILCLILTPFVLRPLIRPNKSSVWSEWKSPPFAVPTTLLILYVVLVTLVLTLKAQLGEHGVDHAIFSQITHSFATKNTFETSLNRIGWRNFLDDHWAPILSLPGLLIKLGIPSLYAIDIFQGLTLAAFAFITYKFLQDLIQHRSIAATATFLILCLRPFRHQIFYGPQLEFFALPLIAASYLFWMRRHYCWLLATLILITFCKETMFLFAGTFAFMVSLNPLRRDPPSKTWRILFLFFCLLFISAFLSYTYGHAWFFHKPYDYLDRAQLSQSLQLPILQLKLWQIITFFLPVLFIPFWSRRAVGLLIPVSPFLAMSFVSGFAPMYETSSHYNLVPALLISFATAITLSERPRWLRRLSPLTILWFFCFNFSWQGNRPTLAIVRWLNSGSLSAPTATDVPLTSSVLVTDSSASFLFDRQLLTYNSSLTCEQRKSYPILVQLISDPPPPDIPCDKISPWFICHPATTQCPLSPPSG